MALGKKLIQWDMGEIIKGMSTSNSLADAGFSPTTDQVNLTNTPGLIYQPILPVDHSTNLTGEMIASSEDPTGSYARLFVSSDTTQDGRFFSMDSSGDLTMRGSEDTAHNYVQGRTDMIGFQGEAYITTDSTIVRWSSIGAANTFDTAFFTFASAIAPHPAIVYETLAYYGDGNLLLRQSTAGGTPGTILTLPTGWIIVALGVDPGSGRMLLSVVGQPNLSDTINSGARVMFYDGFSAQSVRSVLVDDMVTAFANTEGALYASYGQNLGLWNGSGITFLRRLNVDFDNTELLYKQHFTSIGSTLYYIEKSRITALGPVRQKGEVVFYPAMVNQPSGVLTNMSHITNIGRNRLVYSFATSKFFLFDTSSVATAGTQDIYSNVYDFDDEMWIRRIRIIYGNTVANNVDPGSMRLRNEDGIVTTANASISGLLDLKNTSGAASAYKDLFFNNLKLKQLQFELLLDTSNPGVRRVIVYGDPANITT